MSKIHESNESRQHGYWQIRVYFDNQQAPVKTLQVVGKDQAREQYKSAIQQAQRDTAHPIWRVQLVYCYVAEAVWEQDGTMY